MRAEIINVGTELLLGHTINSDGAFIARELATLGLDVLNMQVVGDNPERLENCLIQALQRSDIVITSGGLGPTKDDLTKEIVAKLANRPLIRHEESLARLKEYFGDRSIGENQLKQTLIPEGSTVFKNDAGTAPGCAAPFPGGKLALLLPGPPSELLPMLHSEVIPFLKQMTSASIVSKIIRTFGIGEGDAAQRLDELLDGSNPSIAPYASQGEMFVKLTAKAGSASECEKMLEQPAAAVVQRLGNYVYGSDVDSLEEMVVGELIRQKRSMAVAESCTGGMLAQRITSIPGASAIFSMGVVTYSNQAKEELLEVPEPLLEKFGAVSGQTVRAMAENVRKLAKSDFGAAITGIAGPDGGTPQKPVGLVYIGLSFAGGAWVRVMRPHGRYKGREWVRRMASSHALDLIRRKLTGLPRDL